MGSNALEPITAPPGEGGVRSPSSRDIGVGVPVVLTLSLTCAGSNAGGRRPGSPESWADAPGQLCL